MKTKDVAVLLMISTEAATVPVPLLRACAGDDADRPRLRECTGDADRPRLRPDDGVIDRSRLREGNSLRGARLRARAGDRDIRANADRLRYAGDADRPRLRACAGDTDRLRLRAGDGGAVLVLRGARFFTAANSLSPSLRHRTALVSLWRPTIDLRFARSSSSGLV